MKKLHDCETSDLIQADKLRWEALGAVEELELPEGSIGAGFVRNLVWNHLHGRTSDCRNEDVDVLFFHPERLDRDYETELGEQLMKTAPHLSWSVRNQARMHHRNGDRPYSSVEDAMRFWPETATAVAVSRAGETCHISAPFGLQDLWRMVLRPTSSADHKVAAFEQRITSKNWLNRWPMLSVHPI